METYSVDSIICPRCEAALDVTATSCDQCGASTVAETASAGKRRLLDRPWVIVVLLLHVGVLGIPAYWKTGYSTRIRLMIVAASVVYTIVAVSGIVWGCMQIVRVFEEFS